MVVTRVLTNSVATGAGGLGDLDLQQVSMPCQGLRGTLQAQGCDSGCDSGILRL